MLPHEFEALLSNASHKWAKNQYLAEIRSTSSQAVLPPKHLNLADFSCLIKKLQTAKDPADVILPVGEFVFGLSGRTWGLGFYRRITCGFTFAASEGDVSGFPHSFSDVELQSPEWSPSLLCERITLGGRRLFPPITCFPLGEGGRVMWLLILKGIAHSHDLLEIVQTIADHATLALTTIRETKDLRLDALTDKKTGLANHACFESLLQREFKRTSRIATSPGLTLAMLDLDHFKPYNDTFGHPAGDRFLGVVGSCLLKHVRAADVAARVGGDEFALAFLDTHIEQAFALCESIRTSIKEPKDSELPGAVSVSIGLAQSSGFPNAKELVKAADVACYAAKNSGGNRIVIAATPGGTRI